MLAAGLSGCATSKVAVPVRGPVTAAPVDVLELEESGHAGALSAPAVAAPAPGAGEAEAGAVRPGLHLRISVLVGGRPEFEEPMRQVSDEGAIEVPLIGKVQIAGLTLEQVKALLETRYREYLLDPQVVVEYVQREGSLVSPWGYVTVLGRVRAPGKFPIPATRDLTVSGAIQRAGGFDTSARSSSIRVTRQLPGDKTERLRVNLKAFARGDIDEDITLQAGDVVFVPESIW